MSLNSWQTLLTGDLKKFYTDFNIKAPTGRADPFSRMILQNNFKQTYGNKTVIYSPYGASGVASGDMTVTKAAIAANTNPFGVAFEFDNGNVFSGFMLDKKQIMATKDDKGAFLRAVTGVFATALEAWRRIFAISAFGAGYGDICNAPVLTTVVGSNTITLPINAGAALCIGQSFYVTNGNLPSAALRTSLNTVTSIDEVPGSISTISVTFNATVIETWAATDWICIAGCRDASNNPNLPVGLAALLPAYFNRTGANWNTYIGTSFANVVRSVNTRALAGVYYLGQASDTYLSVLYTLLVKSRNMGGTDGGVKFVMNPVDILNINRALQSKETIYTNYNTKKDGMNISRGLVDFRAWFLNSYADVMCDSPFCPVGRVYMLQDDSLYFHGLVNSSKLVAGEPNGNEPGKQTWTDMQAPGLEYKFDELDSITITPASATVDGEAIMGTFATYGAFGIQAPGFCGVADFGSATVAANS